MGMSASLDHLLALRWHIDTARDQPIRLFPFAHFTLCRSALLGAAQAVWVLAPPERTVRLARSRTVVVYLQEQHLRYLRALQLWGRDDPDPATQEVAAHVEGRQDEMTCIRQADGQKSALNATNMIRDAAQAVFDDPSLVAEVLCAWQEGSGAAHALIWPLLGHADTVVTSGPDEFGRVEAQAAGGFGRFAQNYMAAFLMLDGAWRLLRMRGQLN